MTATRNARACGKGARTTAAQLRRYDQDAILEGLTSGRLSARPLEEATARLLVDCLDALDWRFDARALAGALPHFPDRFGVRELRATLANLGYASSADRLRGHALARAEPGALLAQGERCLGRLVQSANGLRIARLDPPGRMERIARSARYDVIRFEAERPAWARRAREDGWTSRTFVRSASAFRHLLVLTLLSGITTIALSLGIMSVFQTAVGSTSMSTLWGLVAGFTILFIFDVALRLLRARRIGRLAGRLEYRLGSELFGKLLSLPPHMLASASHSEQMSRLRQFESVREMITGPAAMVALELPLALMLLLTITMIAPVLGATLAVLILGLVALCLLLAPGLRRSQRALGEEQGAFAASCHEVVAHRARIARDGSGRHWLQQIDAAATRLARQRREVARRARIIDGVVQVSLPLSAAVVLGVGAAVAMTGGLNSGQLVAVTMLTWRLLAPVQKGIALIAKIPEMTNLLEQIDAFHRLPSEARNEEDHCPVLERAELAAQEVVMRHPGAVSPTLMGVTLSIPHGAFVAVTGSAGSGKSTLLKVLSGQSAPQSGAVRVNGMNLSQSSRGYRARNLVHVGQSPTILYGTIAQNLRFADPMASDDAIEEVLKEVGLGPWLARRSRGIHTRVDPDVDAETLTPSVTFLLAIAQSFLMRPAVVLMDEPTGGMEPELERALITAIETRKGRMTCVLVCHRPSILKRADSVIVLNNGSAGMRPFEEWKGIAA